MACLITLAINIMRIVYIIETAVELLSNIKYFCGWAVLGGGTWELGAISVPCDWGFTHSVLHLEGRISERAFHTMILYLF